MPMVRLLSPKSCQKKKVSELQEIRCQQLVLELMLMLVLVVVAVVVVVVETSHLPFQRMRLVQLLRCIPVSSMESDQRVPSTNGPCHAPHRKFGHAGKRAGGEA